MEIKVFVAIQDQFCLEHLNPALFLTILIFDDKRSLGFVPGVQNHGAKMVSVFSDKFAMHSPAVTASNFTHQRLALYLYCQFIPGIQQLFKGRVLKNDSTYESLIGYGDFTDNTHVEQYDALDIDYVLKLAHTHPDLTGDAS